MSLLNRLLLPLADQAPEHSLSPQAGRAGHTLCSSQAAANIHMCHFLPCLLCVLASEFKKLLRGLLRGWCWSGVLPRMSVLHCKSRPAHPELLVLLRQLAKVRSRLRWAQQMKGSKQSSGGACSSRGTNCFAAREICGELLALTRTSWADPGQRHFVSLKLQQYSLSRLHSCFAETPPPGSCSGIFWCSD